VQDATPTATPITPLVVILAKKSSLWAPRRSTGAPGR
jgi:hypothetical protein